MFKKILTIAVLAATLTACRGELVEVPTANVGVIQTRQGVQEQVIAPSKFRLPWCWSYCDKLITMDVSDTLYKESFSTYMPKDELVMDYTVSMTMNVDSSAYMPIFLSIPAASISNHLAAVDPRLIYSKYAEQKIETLVPQLMANFEIGEVASSRERVNEYLTNSLREAMKGTNLSLRVAGLAEVKYPEIITKAKEEAARRRETENQILAQRDLDLIQIETTKQVAEKQREVDLYKAKTDAYVAQEMMSPEYETILKYETLKLLAASPNKVFVPAEMLDGLAVQAEAAK